MPSGMRNAPATFQRMMNQSLRDLPSVEVYVDDIVIHSDTWKEHLCTLQAVLDTLKEVDLTVNLTKSEFGQAKVIYLGHVGHGQVAPVEAKIKSISSSTKQKKA